PNGIVVPIVDPTQGGCKGGSSTSLPTSECPKVIGFGLFKVVSYACVDANTGRTAGCSGNLPTVQQITGHWIQKDLSLPTCQPGENSCSYSGLKVIDLTG